MGCLRGYWFRIITHTLSLFAVQLYPHYLVVIHSFKSKISLVAPQYTFTGSHDVTRFLSRVL